MLQRRRRFSQLSRVGQHIAQRESRKKWKAAGERFVTARAVAPSGFRLVTGKAEMAARLASGAPRRSDAAANRAAIVAALVSFRDWQDLTISVGQQRLAELASRQAGRPISRSCVGDHLRAMERAGLLHVVMRGCSKLVNGMGRDFAPVYVVIEPDLLAPEDQVKVELLKRRLAGETRQHHVGVVNYEDLQGSLGHNRGRIIRATPQRRLEPGRFVPRTAAERRQTLAWIAGILQIDFDTYRKELTRGTAPFFDAGWTGAAIVYAVSHDRNGAADWSRVVDGYWTMRVFNHRLSRWRDADRAPVPAPRVSEQPSRGRPVKALPVREPAEPVRATTPGAAARAELDAARARLTALRGPSQRGIFRRW